MAVARQIGWGILGTADIARNHMIPGLHEADNARVVAIGGRDPEKVKKFQEDFGIPKGYTDFDELLDDPEVEAVYIPLFNTLHETWAVRAMKKGKHVLCEKPLAPTEAEMRRMIAASEETGCVLMEAFAYLHSPFVASMKKAIDDGEIGDIVYIDSSFIESVFPLENMRMRRDVFGGGMYGQGCYCTTLISWLLEEEPETITSVGQLSKEGIDQFAGALLTYASGRRAFFTSGMILQADKYKRIDRIAVYGTEGVLKSDLPFNGCGDMVYTIEKDDGTKIERHIATPQNYRLEAEQLGRCILNGEKPHVSHEFSLLHGRITDRVHEAIGY